MLFGPGDQEQCIFICRWKRDVDNSTLPRTWAYGLEGHIWDGSCNITVKEIFETRAIQHEKFIFWHYQKETGCNSHALAWISGRSENIGVGKISEKVDAY